MQFLEVVDLLLLSVRVLFQRGRLDTVIACAEQRLVREAIADKGVAAPLIAALARCAILRRRRVASHYLLKLKYLMMNLATSKVQPTLTAQWRRGFLAGTARLLVDSWTLSRVCTVEVVRKRGAAAWSPKRDEADSTF